MVSARQTFDRIRNRTLPLPNAPRSLGHAANGESQTALQGRQSSTSCVELQQATLIHMYSKCGSMADAQKVFDALRKRDVVTWTALMLGYASNGKGETALELFFRMKAEGECIPDAFTHIAALKACASLAVNGAKDLAMERGRAVHLEAAAARHDQLHHPKLACTLVAMYGKCGCMAHAQRVFDSMQMPSVACWNALLYGHAENGDGETALNLFSRMKRQGCSPNAVTYVAVVKACSSLAESGRKPSSFSSAAAAALERGKQIHAEAEAGGQLDEYVLSALIHMYGKLSSMAEAQSVFDRMRKPSVVSWNALLQGYADNDEGKVALSLFTRMKALHNPDVFTYNAALKACASLAVSSGDSREEALKWGRRIHSEVNNDGELLVKLHPALIDMYARCGSLEEARRVFHSVKNPDVRCWNALLLAHTENGESGSALELFSRMRKASPECSPDSVTYVAALKAVACLAVTSRHKDAALKQGREVHSEAGRSGRLLLDSYVCNMLIDMYGKCGSMVEAQRVFDSMERPTLVSWNALIHGYADNGKASVALELLTRMRTVAAGCCKPDAVTFIAAVKSCGLIGALALGRKLHAEVNEFPPALVTILVDFYAKCGSISEACEVYDAQPRGRELSATTALLEGHARFGDGDFVFALFEAMQDAGLKPDAVAMMCVLVCCSHAGLPSKAKACLRGMRSQHSIAPDVWHYNCIVDALGRANQLEEAVELVRAMPCQANAVTWITLLASCRKWKNAEIGKWAFQSLVEADETRSYAAAAHVLMAGLYDVPAGALLVSREDRTQVKSGPAGRNC